MLSNENNILLVEDNHAYIDPALRLFSQQGFKVTVAYEEKEAVSTFKREQFGTLLVDMKLAEGTGLGALQAIQKLDVHSETVVVWADDVPRYRQRAAAAGIKVDAWIPKASIDPAIDAQLVVEEVIKLRALRYQLSRPQNLDRPISAPISMHVQDVPWRKLVPSTVIEAKVLEIDECHATARVILQLPDNKTAIRVIEMERLVHAGAAFPDAQVALEFYLMGSASICEVRYVGPPVEDLIASAMPEVPDSLIKLLEVNGSGG